MGVRIHLTNIYWEFTRFQVLGLEPGLRGEEVSEMSKTCALFTRNAVRCRRQAHYVWVLVGWRKGSCGLSIWGPCPGPCELDFPVLSGDNKT